MYKKELSPTGDVTTRNYRKTSPHIYIVAHVIMYYCQRHQWNSNHLFALLCGVADRPPVCIVASLRILYSNREHCHIVVSLKFYEQLTRYYGYCVLSVSTLGFTASEVYSFGRIEWFKFCKKCYSGNMDTQVTSGQNRQINTVSSNLVHFKVLNK
jgi:hypothetical protein